jgi:23S rRNA (guanine745-N1)-methyltransferase
LSLPIPPLSCTVRDCGLLLERRGRVMTCARQHSYDIARSGYINLLQPQDRRSPKAGDELEAIEARARLLNADVGRTVLDAVVERAVPSVPPEGVVADLGSGSGEVLGELSKRTNGLMVGVDLSIDAVDYAARRFPRVTWVVANADRRLPLLDHTVDLIVSMHGRRHPAECQRVLAHRGHLLVAVPAADDLIELRTAVQGQRVERERIHLLIAEHEEHFEVVEQFDARERRHVERNQIRDLLRGTYRGTRRSTAQVIDSLDALDVTLASTIVVFRPRVR